MLKVSNLTKYFGEQKILNKISFVVERGHKIALVGFNGTGKTTLLKILSGEQSDYKGKVEFQKNITVGFLPQDPNQYNSEKVIKFLEKYVGDNSPLFYRDVEIMFAGFALPSEVKNKKIGELSSGQKTKVFLTGLLLKRVDLMFLDEPTNNLDLPALIWLEDFLQNTKSSFIVVSHDKTFLDHVANKIYELDWKDRTLEITNGRYSDYLIQKQKEKERQKLQHEIQKQDIKQLRVVIKQKQEKFEKGRKYQGTDNDRILRGYRRDKAGDSLRDAKVVNNRIKRMDIIENPNNRKEFNIEINPEDQGKSRDILISDLVCGYGDGFEVGPINLDIPFTSKVCILGLNGSGKSTLLKTITGRISEISGKISVGSGVKFGNLMQEHESLPGKETVLGFLMKRIDVEKNILHNHLKHFGFIDEQMKTKIETLSPGGRARLLLAYFSADNVNVLILDEPTNHLDMEAEEALSKTLQKFEGTVLVVTHDRFFVEKTGTDLLYVLEDGKLTKIKDFKQYVSEMEKRAKKLLRMLRV